MSDAAAPLLTLAGWLLLLVRFVAVVVMLLPPLFFAVGRKDAAGAGAGIDEPLNSLR